MTVTRWWYGGLAGEESGEDRLRSHFADPAAEPLVMLEFWFREFIDGDAAAEPLEYAILKVA